MNAKSEMSEIRELTTDELDAVAGGIVGGHAVVYPQDVAIGILSAVGLGVLGGLVPR